MARESDAGCCTRAAAQGKGTEEAAALQEQLLGLQEQHSTLQEAAAAKQVRALTLTQPHASMRV